MAKTESTLKNMVLTLLVITGIAGVSLGFVHSVTKEPIALAKQAKQQKAITKVVPAFDNIPGEEAINLKSKTGADIKVFPAKKAGELVGIAVETVSNKGFGGEVKIMVGFQPDGTIIDYMALEHKETPGLGTKMDVWFKTDKKNQSIIGKHPEKNNLTVSKDGGEVDAITAATISSRAFLDALHIAWDTYKDTQTTATEAKEESPDNAANETITNNSTQVVTTEKEENNEPVE